MSFQDLNLHSQILKALIELGFETPTPIQEEAIPKVLAGLDLRASAQTGTGKTAAFLLPSLQKISTPSTSNSRGPRVLILVPTRELAMQVAEESVKYSKYLPRSKTVCIYGGAPYPTQIRELSRPHEILVATPGRLIDHLDRGRIDFSRLEVLVLDEADRMLDMGFIEPVETIAAATPKNRQTLMFSATLKGSVMNLSKRLLNNPVEITVSSEFAKHENIEQRLYYVDDLHHKQNLLNHFLSDPTVTQAIVFTSTKRHADQLVDELYEGGFQAAALHGDMNQRQRTRTITQLRQGQVRILVATDVAARGIDISTITHVFNFDLPNNPEDYVHRIGRTGRAGANGISLSFASSKDLRLVKEIEIFTGQKVAVHVVPGMEPKPFSSKRESAGPRKRGPGSRGGSGGGRGQRRFDRPRSESRSSEQHPPRERSHEPREQREPREPRSYGARSERPAREKSHESREPRESRGYGARSELRSFDRPVREKSYEPREPRAYGSRSESRPARSESRPARSESRPARSESRSGFPAGGVRKEFRGKKSFQGNKSYSD